MIEAGLAAEYADTYVRDFSRANGDAKTYVSQVDIFPHSGQVSGSSWIGTNGGSQWAPVPVTLTSSVSCSAGDILIYGNAADTHAGIRFEQ